MKFDWASITPKLKIRAGAPIGSGNTRYMLTPDFMPGVADIDVENSTHLDDLTIQSKIMTEQTIEKPEVKETTVKRKDPEQLAKQVEELIFKNGVSECSAIEVLTVLRIVEFKVLGSIKKQNG